MRILGQILIVCLIAFPVFAQISVNGGIANLASHEDALNQENAKKCESEGGIWGMFNDYHNMPRCKTLEEQKSYQECKTQGGTWAPDGKAQLPRCHLTYPDANKPCQQNAECMSKKCLANKVDAAHGKCHGNNSPFGCFEYFNKSDGPAVCVD